MFMKLKRFTLSILTVMVINNNLLHSFYFSFLQTFHYRSLTCLLVAYFFACNEMSTQMTEYFIVQISLNISVQKLSLTTFSYWFRLYIRFIEVTKATQTTQAQTVASQSACAYKKFKNYL